MLRHSNISMNMVRGRLSLPSERTTELDFEAMARARFLNEVNPGLISAAEGETIWRRLRKDGKIIVLADGLEEALIAPGAQPERDNIIRRAHQHHLLSRATPCCVCDPHSLRLCLSAR
jgi:hypothetical protein